MRIEEGWLGWGQLAGLVSLHAGNDEQNDTAEDASGETQCSLDLVPQDKADQQDEAQQDQGEGEGGLGDLIGLDGGEEDLEDILADDDDVD
jgi:hypothetical protein